MPAGLTVAGTFNKASQVINYRYLLLLCDVGLLSLLIFSLKVHDFGMNKN